MGLDGIGGVYIRNAIGFGDGRNRRMGAPGSVETIGEGFNGREVLSWLLVGNWRLETRDWRLVSNL